MEKGTIVRVIRVSLVVQILCQGLWVILVVQILLLWVSLLIQILLLSCTNPFIVFGLWVNLAVQFNFLPGFMGQPSSTD